ncbi:hypothetical protein [Dyadobacter sp. 3J3]|uniref:hypothetical protein n=1 Tax=Dyadobacter sp. 3J3 TaxID=2606600 RepID=UPI00135C8671|nr:hypothetical protein [Dyadobacter sp. 3J3]
MKKLLTLSIFFILTITSCSNDKNLAEPKNESESEELYTTREFEVDGPTYIDYINSKGVTEFTMGGNLIDKK